MKHKFLVTALLLATAPALAAKKEQETTTKVKTTSKTEVRTNENLEKFSRTVVDESMANRDGKDFTLNVTLAGSSYGANASAIEIGKHLNTNTVITLQATDLKPYWGDEDGDDYDDRIWARDGKGTAISLGLKKFTGNSFYIKPELYMRNQEAVYSTSSIYENGVTTYYKEEYAKYRDLGVSFKIGNQWQWENFTIGCDWIGLTRSVTHTEISGKVKENQLSSGSILNFYMGATF